MNTTDKSLYEITGDIKDINTLLVGRAEIEALVRERDEADRRAGAAERHASGLADDLQRMYRVRDEMKDQWGVSRQVSFDVVWAEALALKAAMQEKNHD